MMKTTTLLTAIGSLALTGARDGAAANIDFESPTYSVGDITLQDAWIDGNTTAITATDPIAGNQSAISTDISPTTSIYDVRDIRGERIWADGSRISTLFRAENNGTVGSFFDFRFDSQAGFLGDVTVNAFGQNVDAHDGTIVGPITAGTPYQIVVVLNFTADTYDVILQTVSPSNPEVVTGTIGTAPGIAFGNASSAADAAARMDLRLRAQNGGGAVAGASVLWDNILIESLPGPDIVDSTDINVEDTPAVSFDSVAGITYRLQSTPDLVSSNYTDVGAFLEGNGLTQLLFDPDGPTTSKNYRVATVP